MPRRSLGPRLYMDPVRQQWVIRHGKKFIRTGCAGWRGAIEKLREYQPEIDPGRSAPTRGFIYFISADSADFPVKIGFTKKMDSLRLRGLQTGCPYALQMLGAIPGTYQNERALHRQFAKDRLSGEWFRRTPELMEFIAGASR